MSTTIELDVLGGELPWGPYKAHYCPGSPWDIDIAATCEVNGVTLEVTFDLIPADKTDTWRRAPHRASVTMPDGSDLWEDESQSSGHGYRSRHKNIPKHLVLNAIRQIVKDFNKWAVEVDLKSAFYRRRVRILKRRTERTKESFEHLIGRLEEHIRLADEVLAADDIKVEFEKHGRTLCAEPLSAICFPDISGP